MDRIQQFLILLSKRSDIALAALLVAVIFMMIIPLPTVVVDTLVATNMSFAAILLMVAMYLSSPLSFSAFPAVLLVTTLFRLALSITTTRLILLQADAGDIIETFGNFVIAGNIVVGLVVFLIITIVQFIVITKGSERVAEVSARFSLDAMPGKQMSIDGDMRAGVIDMDQARHRRLLVEKESQLYGAMDGAMKFVKGDAIAGLIIIAVNIVGGITIGTTQNGMATGEALQTYSILTVGDGLVSQIPALFISITAGIIVTRVTTKEDSNLGADIGQQVTNEPRALFIASVICIGFALIPGMPSAIFLIIAFITTTGGYFMLRYRKTTASKKKKSSSMVPSVVDDDEEHDSSSEDEKEGDLFSLAVPLMIDMDVAMKDVLKVDIFNEELKKLRRALYHDLGVPFPSIQLRFNKRQPAGTYSILVQEIPVSQGYLKPGFLFVREKQETLEIMDINMEKGKNFLPSLPTIWVQENKIKELKTAGVPFLTSSGVLSYHLSFVLKRYAQEFIGLQETRSLIEKMEKDYPEIVKEVQRILPVQKLTEIFQRLVSEDVSIRNLRAIFELIIEWGQKEKDVVVLTEYVRNGLKRQISFQHAGIQNILPAYLFTHDVEDTIRNAIRQTSAGNYLALDPETSASFIKRVKEAVGSLYAHNQPPVLLTSMDVRRYVRKVLEKDLFELPVLSYQELTSDITVQPLAKIELS